MKATGAKRRVSAGAAAILAALWSEGLAAAPYRTENVVIAIMDGVHYDRTFGDPDHALIPHLWNDLRPQGTYYSNFFNNSVTITLAGHGNVMTGAWQYMRNRGAVQTRPTVIHYLADEASLGKNQAWVVFGKGYYAYNPETTFPAYKGSYEPGFAYGLGEATYQDDYDVLEKVTEVMKADRPRIVFANFGVTDHTAHTGNWEYHTGAVKNCDTVLFKLWNAIQADPHYRDKTTLIITSDHGYMDDGVHDGFAEHGDASEGSRRVMLLLLGPDIRKGHAVTSPAYHIDIAPTVGELLGFQTPLSPGEVLKESLVAYQSANRKEARTDRARRAVEQERLARLDLVSHFGDKVLGRYADGPATLAPSAETTFLLWGMLIAHDKTGKASYLDLVRRWVDAQAAGGAEPSVHVALLSAQLAYRTKDKRERGRLAGIAGRGARAVIGELERRGARGVSLPQFVLEMILPAAVSEIARDEALWHRVAKVYLDHVQARDHERARRHVMELGRSSGAQKHRPEGELVEASGKVLPDLASSEAAPESSWYLLAAAFIRSHGLPYKGENLGDLPTFHAEVIYQTYLAVQKLPHPGHVWDDALEAALNVAAIREARRRVTLRGKLYEGVDQLTAFDLGRLRPESAEIMPPIGKVRETIRERITQTNYNVQYGFPAYEDLDFSIDALRLYADRIRDDLATGLFLMAVDPARRVSVEPFVASPR